MNCRCVGRDFSEQFSRKVFSLVEVVMKIVLLISLLLFVSCDVSTSKKVYFPLDYEVLNTSCTKDGVNGVHKLFENCTALHGEEEFAGFVKFVGAVVCCTSKHVGFPAVRD